MANQLKVAVVHAIEVLLERGWSQRRIAGALGVDRGTVTGYYKNYCYLPLYIFCGEHLLCARLRPSNIDASTGSVNELERIGSQIREKWPQVRIVIRGDSGFCREHIMAWCEANDVDFVLD